MSAASFRIRVAQPQSVSRRIGVIELWILEIRPVKSLSDNQPSHPKCLLLNRLPKQKVVQQNFESRPYLHGILYSYSGKAQLYFEQTRSWPFQHAGNQGRQRMNRSENYGFRVNGLIQLTLQNWTVRAVGTQGYRLTCHAPICEQRLANQ